METGNSGIDCRVRDNIRFNARRLARSRAVPGMERQDYEQDLLVDLLHRSKAFDPRRASYRTFADRIVGHRIKSLATATRRLTAERNTVSLDQLAVDEGQEVTLLDLLPDQLPPVEAAVALRIDLGRFVQHLPPPLLQGCRLLLADSISEGAREVGIHRSTAHERITHLRERAGAYGLGEYFPSKADSFAGWPVNDRDSSTASSTREPRSMAANFRNAGARLLLTDADLAGWLCRAKATDALEYYRGFLMIDMVAQCSRLPDADRAELSRIAHRARQAADDGLAFLLQRRYGPCDYGYLLVAKSRPPDPASPQGMRSLISHTGRDVMKPSIQPNCFGCFQHALALSAQGLPCFPCSFEKTPKTPHGFKDATCDREVLHALWRDHPGPLIGVRTGEVSGLDVLDVDVRNGGGEWYAGHRDRLPQTRVHRTRSGGIHLIFRHKLDLRCSSSRIAAGVDVRAEGGYVIWWPAAGYPVLNEADPAPWPEWLCPPSPAPRPAAHRLVVPSELALTRLIRVVVEAPQGARNNLTFWAACRAGEMVASGMLKADTAAAIIAEAATRTGLSYVEAERTVWSGLRARGGPRHG